MRTSRRWILSSAMAGVAWAAVAFGAGAQESRYDLLVSSSATHSVKRFDGRTGAYVDDLVPPGGSGLNNTQEILLKGSDILVVGFGTQSVLRFDRRRGSGSPFTSGYGLQGPTKANWGPDGHLYVSQWAETQSAVAVFHGGTGAFIREATPDLDRPMDQAWDAGGTLYVLSFGTRDVRRFAPDGNLIDVFVRPDEHLAGPVNMWFDDAGDLIIVDWTSGTIQKYSGADGSHVAELVTGLTNPEGWDVGPDGRLFVAEWNVHRVRPVDLATGEVGASFAVGGALGDPNGLLFVERLPDFSIMASSGSATLSGGNASVSLSLTPLRDVPVTDPVALACSSSSPAVSCSLSMSSVTLGSASATVDLRLTRTSAAGVTWLVGLIAVLGLLAGGARRGSVARGLAVALLVGVSGCGGDSTGPGPDPGVSAQVTVTAQLGTLTRSVSLAVSGS